MVVIVALLLIVVVKVCLVDAQSVLPAMATLSAFGVHPELWIIQVALMNMILKRVAARIFTLSRCGLFFSMPPDTVSTVHVTKTNKNHQF